MKIVQYLIPGIDCPAELAMNPNGKNRLERVTRYRLELRPTDDIEIVFVDKYPE